MVGSFSKDKGVLTTVQGHNYSVCSRDCQAYLKRKKNPLKLEQMQRMGMESLFYAESLDHSGFFSRTKAEMVCSCSP